MIIKEINNMLDRQGVLSFAANTKIEKFLDDNGITALARVRVTEDGGYAIMNFENEEYDEKQILEHLKEFSPKITKDAVMLKIESPSATFLDGFKTLNSVPSVVIDAVIFTSGYYYIYFRFNSSDESKLTAALRSELIEYDRFALRYLGKSPGMVSTFKEISSEIPLTYVEITGSVPPSFMRVFDDPVLMNLGVSWTREMKFLLGDEIRAVYYDKSALLRGKEEWIHEISKEKRIYETAFTNSLVQHLITKISQQSIVTMGMPQKLLGKTFSIATVVPDIVLPDFFKQVYETIKEFKNWDLDIGFVEQFEIMSME